MQVKRFEAATVQEALTMVKGQLGPDAIILNVKDNRKAFGLVGRGSVEITAAISEKSLSNRRQVESRLPEEKRKQFQQSPARQQKEIIERSMARRTQKPEPVRAPRPVTSTPYIDIADEEKRTRTTTPAYTRRAAKPVRGQRVESMMTELDSAPEFEEAAPPQPGPGSERVKEAVKRAWVAAQEPLTTVTQAAATTASNSAEVHSLRSEIGELKKMIESLKTAPSNGPRSLHPGAEEGLSYEVSAMFERLIDGGLDREFAVGLLKHAQDTFSAMDLRRKAPLESWVAKQILERVRIADSSRDSKIHCFVGAAGSGKTSALVKMASHMVIHQKMRVAIVTTDLGKVGAAEQLRIYASILNVPFAIVRGPSDWKVVMEQLGSMNAILADFPGTSLTNDTEMNRLRALLPPADYSRRVHYVTSCTSRDEEAYRSLNRYRGIGVDDLIINNLDQAIRHGIVFNLQEKFETPILAFGRGPLIPEDFEFASRERVLDLIFRISRMANTESKGVEL